MTQPDPFPAHRYQGLLRFVHRRAEEALRRCGFDPLPPFKEFVFTRHHGALILFLVLDEKHLERPTRDYLSDGVLHEISTLTRGLKVARSNSNGARYAILLSRPARLPKSIPFPDNTPPDAFPLGMTRSGPLTLPAETAGHFLVGGAPRSGKSNFLTGLAFTAIENGWLLYLADPQGVTFSHDWNRIAAYPVASSLAEFTNLLAQVQAEMTRRGSLFETARKPSGLAVQKIEDYNRFAPAPLPRLLLVVDEANTYLDKRGVTDAVADLARQGLKYGIHLARRRHPAGGVGQLRRAADLPGGG
jgi:hypothetical protein